MFPIRDTIPSRGYPVMVWAIIIVNTAVFILELRLPGSQLKDLFFLFGFVPARYSNLSLPTNLGNSAAYLSFLTSMFMHGGWMHLISNMWSLWIFGDNVEDRMGHVRFLLFYILTGIAAGLMHLFTNLNSAIPVVGASGAIAGVMGAYFLLFPYARIVTLFPVFFYPVFIEVPAVFFLGIWLYSQFLSGVMSAASAGQVGGIAWWAHVGGFMTGALLMPLFVRRRVSASHDSL